MPEFLHNFTAGKMNKDLDERLVPNGEYRDALNLEITDSDNSDVGALQNIRGNVRLFDRYYNIATGVSTPWDSNYYIDSLIDAKCIGKIVDNTTERIYWFISSNNANAIAEYDQKLNIITPILVEYKSVSNFLNFSPDYLITGINIIEGLLFWTDNQTEPKTINIEFWRGSTTDFISHSQIYGRNFIEADITVIRKHPLTAPTIYKAASAVGGPGTGITPVTTTYTIAGNENFTYIPNPITHPEIYVSLPTYAQVQANPLDYPSGITGEVTFTTNTAPSWIVGNTILLSGSVVDDYNQTFEYEVRILITVINGNVVTGRIQAISSNIKKFPNGIGGFLPIVWNGLLEEKTVMFEFKFPRFAYRWKYNNNEYSAFSPFSEVAFIGNEFKYISSDGYNIGMTNNIRVLRIENIDWGDEFVKEIEVLYKESDQTAVYKVDKLKDKTINYLGITSEIIGAAVESNQLLRPWDNVPRKAKAQEITGNRLLFGNYTQNYDITSSVVLSVQQSPQPHPGTINQTPIGGGAPTFPYLRMPYPSIKSIRNYQIGIVYSDKYGRDTPVFTNATAAFNVPKSSASTVNALSVTPQNLPPNWATHYKFFVKEIANEYYNLALDRFYFAEDGNVWLSFPSSERNKVDETTYLILKKQHDNDVPVAEDARYKILSIQNSPPLFISTFKINVTSGNCTSLVGFEKDSLFLAFDGPTGNADFNNGITADHYISIQYGTNITGTYAIQSGGFTGSGSSFTITLVDPLGTDALFLNSLPYSATVTINIIKDQQKNLPEFDGRFFVKINRDSAFDNNIVASFKALKTRYGITSEVLKNGVKAVFGLGASEQWGWYFLSRVDFVSNFEPVCSDEYQLMGMNLSPYFNGWEFQAGQQVSQIYGRPFIGSRNIGITYCGTDPEGFNPANGGRFFNIEARIGALLRLKHIDGRVSEKPYTITNATVAVLHRGRHSIQLSGSPCGDNHQKTDSGNNMMAIAIVLDRPIDDPWAGNGEEGDLNNIAGYQIVKQVNSDHNKLLTSSNPAIFETEPKKSVDLNLYYEATDSFPIVDHNTTKALKWWNCFSYGNGVESNRIRDDYNATLIDKGVKVSTVLDKPYATEIKSTGLIYSGIFNSVSGVNNLNQFIQAESITKDLNPYYGSIQALLSRDTDVVTFCEDKILNILANKDALYNANGDANLTATNRVLGQETPYIGEFGISTNPESLASYGFRVYFTDKSRGAVLRLSRDGIEPISDKGMKAFFFDNLTANTNLIGSFNNIKGAYNLTLNNLTPKWRQLFATGQYDRTNPDCDEHVTPGEVTSTTLLFKENAEGWTSRVSYIQETGCSLNSDFYTFKDAQLWRHTHTDPLFKYNNFYGTSYESSINVLINESPEIVKGFKTLNYTGSRQKEYIYSNGDGYNYSIAQLQADNIIPTGFSTKDGWYANYIVTDLQEGQIKEFIKKEGKYFNYIKGLNTFFNTDCDNNVNSQEFAVQGIGRAISITGDIPTNGFAIHVFAPPEC